MTEHTDDPAGEQASIWLATGDDTDYDELTDTVHVNTAVVGGGIAGLTTAFHLDAAGQSVAVLERDRIVRGVTGHTTAKLTSLHGLVYDDLIETFGEGRARKYANANEAAIDTVERLVETHDIDCDFERTPAYTYTESPDDVGTLRDEVAAASRLGLPATYTESTTLPFDVAGAVRFEEQARFDPRRYLLALASEIDDSERSHVFERTRATDVESGDPCRVGTDSGQVAADDVVVATNFPIYDHAFYYARLVPKRSYVLALRLAAEPPTGLYYDPDEPYFSVRPLPGEDEPMVLVGGQNHRTGHGGSTVERYRRLERLARERFDVEAVAYRWATQDYRSVDTVPFVGKHSPLSDHLYVATGFGGWGMTNGTAGGRLLADRILGRENQWAEVYRPTRFNVGGSAGALLEHNKRAMRHFFQDHLGGPPTEDVRGIPAGAAEVVELDGESVGVYHDEDGDYHLVSAVCPHMGCRVEWNDAERSWDCPCHGSRFDYDGGVLHTPAIDDLERYDIEASTGDD